MNIIDRLLLNISFEKGHFVFASGRHSYKKIEFDNIAKSKFLVDLVSKRLAKETAKNFPEVEVIVTVANGANILAEPVASNLSKILKKEVRALKTSKDSSKNFFLDQDAKLKSGSKCLIIDDVYNHGTNSGKVEKLLKSQKVKMTGIAVVFNRNPKNKPGVVSLINCPLQDWSAEECSCQKT